MSFPSVLQASILPAGFALSCSGLNGLGAAGDRREPKDRSRPEAATWADGIERYISSLQVGTQPLARYLIVDNGPKC